MKSRRNSTGRSPGRKAEGDKGRSDRRSSGNDRERSPRPRRPRESDGEERSFGRSGQESRRPRPERRDDNREERRPTRGDSERRTGGRPFGRPEQGGSDSRERRPSTRGGRDDRERSFDRDSRPTREGSGARSAGGRSGDREKRSGSEGRQGGERSYGERGPARRGDDRESGSDRRSSRDERRSGERSYGERRPARRGDDSESGYSRRESRSGDDRPSRGTGKPYEKKGAGRSEGFGGRDKPYASRERSRGGRRTDGKPRAPRKSAEPKESNGEMRLNKYIAHAGVCSRREADELIQAGAVAVNGKIITELGYKVMPGDRVQYGGETLTPEKPVYVLLNKPKDYITTTDDPQKRKTVLELVRDAGRERIYPVGRLDRNTTGLLLLTNDGELSKKLMHPRYGIKKVYQVTTDKAVTRDDLKKMLKGFELEDGFVKADAAEYVGDGQDKKEIGIELHSGKNRVVRRMMEALGYAVVKLDRVMFAGLTKKDLPRGKWRFLSEKEVTLLKMQFGNKK